MYVDPEKKIPGGTSRTGICNSEKTTDKGVKWLTSYSGIEAGTPQVVYTDDDRIVILWETENKNGDINTYYMVLSSNGKKLQKATKIKNVRLNAYEEPIYKDGYIYWSTCGNGYNESGELRNHRLNIKSFTFDKDTLNITNMKTKKSGTKVTLSWKNNDIADGYLVYKHDGKKYKQAKKIKTNKVTFEKLKKGKTYKYAVKAYKVINGKTYYGKMKYVKVEVAKK